jgi:hypothetical protein
MGLDTDGDSSGENNSEGGSKGDDDGLTGSESDGGLTHEEDAEEDSDSEDGDSKDSDSDDGDEDSDSDTGSGAESDGESKDSGSGAESDGESGCDVEAAGRGSSDGAAPLRKRKHAGVSGTGAEVRFRGVRAGTCNAAVPVRGDEPPVIDLTGSDDDQDSDDDDADMWVEVEEGVFAPFKKR